MTPITLEDIKAEHTRLAELIAHVGRLREALEYSLQAWKYDGVSDEHGSIFAKADSVCDATPEQSFARLRNDVLEECEAMICKELFDSTLRRNLIENLRAMKEPE